MNAKNIEKLNDEHIIKGLQGIRDGINELLEYLLSESNAAPKSAPATTAKSSDTEESSKDSAPEKKTRGHKVASLPKKPAKKEESEEEPEEPEETEEDSGEEASFSKEDLDKMSYGNMKKLAKSCGIPAIGNRAELTKKLLSVKGTAEDEDSGEAEDTSATDDAEDEKEDEDPVLASVLAATEDMSNEDLADLLTQVGVSPKGKRQTLIDKIVKAVNDGLLDMGADDEADDDSGEDESEDSDSGDSADDEDEDDVNDDNNPNMTPARLKAIKAHDKSIRDQYAKKKASRKDLVSFLQDFYDTKESMEDMSDDEVLDTYIDAVCRLIDDDGNMHEGQDAYVMNGKPSCCGRYLSYSEDTNMYICEHCGTEYEAE